MGNPITIDTPDGRETLFTSRDFVDIVRKYISDDAATYLEEIISDNENANEFLSELDDYYGLED